MILLQMVLGLSACAIGLLMTVPIIALSLPFWLVSALTRAFLKFFQPPIIRWPELFEFHPRLGWKAKPNYRAYCLEERDDVFEVATGADGWASSRTTGDSQVVVFGDSHAFGYGVDTRSAFFHVARVPIKAIGAPGYNMVQEVLLMEELGPSLRGKVVVWFVYYGNDLYDNLAPEMNGYRAPFVAQTADGVWRIETSHINPSKWSASLGRQGRQMTRIPENFFKKSFLGDRAFSACEFLICEGNKFCQQAGAELVVMTIPIPIMLEASPTLHGKRIDTDYPDQKIREICCKFDVDLICLKDLLHRSDYKPYDEHWSERGHRAVARAIDRIYAEKTALMNHVDQKIIAKPQCVSAMERSTTL
jgi:hypothetical protein